MELQPSGKMFEKYSNIKFNENPSSGSRAVPFGLADMTKLTVTFRNLRTSQKIAFYCCYWRLVWTNFIKTCPVFRVGRQDSIQWTGIPVQISNIWLLKQACKSTRGEVHKEGYWSLSPNLKLSEINMRNQNVGMLNIAGIFKGLLQTFSRVYYC